MDINEWVLLSDDGFLDADEKQIFLGRRNPESKSVFDLSYSDPSPKSSETTEEPSRVSKQLVHVPIQFEARIGEVPDDESEEKNQIQNIEEHVGVTLVPSATATEKIKAPQLGDVVEADDQDSFSQVSFQIKENKFVDMKMDSPKSCIRGLFPPPLDAGALKFEDKGEEDMEIMASPRMKIEKEMVNLDCNKEEEDSTGGFNIWKWGLTGVGAICSFGVAAATISILFFGSQQRNKFQQEKIQFQIYTDDKRIKQVVQHATKLNEAIATVRGFPLSRAHITYGGYYDGL